MQLLLILALLMANGKGDTAELFKEVQPFLKDMGMGDLQNTFKQAEELSAIISALESSGGIFGNAAKSAGQTEEYGEKNTFPLAPIAPIADKNITYCMTKYLSEEG